MLAGSGRLLREDNTIINEANYLSPVHLNSEVINLAGNGILENIPSNAGGAYIYVDGDIRFWLDGVAIPSAQSGLKLSNVLFMLSSVDELLNFKAYSESAILNVSYIE